MGEENEGGELDHLEHILREELEKHQFAAHDFAIVADEADENGYILSVAFYFDENIVPPAPKSEPAKKKKTKTAKPTGPIEEVKVICVEMYRPEQEDELPMLENDVIIVEARSLDEGWWFGRLNGRVGIFPSACVDILKGNPENLPIQNEEEEGEEEEEVAEATEVKKAAPNVEPAAGEKIIPTDKEAALPCEKCSTITTIKVGLLFALCDGCGAIVRRQWNKEEDERIKKEEKKRLKKELKDKELKEKLERKERKRAEKKKLEEEMRKIQDEQEEKKRLDEKNRREEMKKMAESKKELLEKIEELEKQNAKLKRELGWEVKRREEEEEKRRRIDERKRMGLNPTPTAGVPKGPAPVPSQPLPAPPTSAPAMVGSVGMLPISHSAPISAHQDGTGVGGEPLRQPFPDGSDLPDPTATPRGTAITQRKHTLTAFDKDDKAKAPKKKGKLTRKEKQKDKHNKDSKAGKDKAPAVSGGIVISPVGAIRPSLAAPGTTIGGPSAIAGNGAIGQPKTRPISTPSNVLHPVDPGNPSSDPENIDWEAREEEERVRNIMGKVVLPTDVVLMRKENLSRLQKTHSGRFMTGPPPGAGPVPSRLRDRGIVRDPSEPVNPDTDQGHNAVEEASTDKPASLSASSPPEGLRMLPSVGSNIPRRPPPSIPPAARDPHSTEPEPAPMSPHEPTTAPPRPSVPPVAGKPILKPRTLSTTQMEDETPIVIPTWTKGPPTTPEEVAEYKAFMKAKYEAETKENARLLRLKQAGLG